MSDGGTTALVARTEVRATLERAVRAVATHESIVVRGDPGIGKTSLLDDAARVAHRTGATVLRAVGSEAEAAMPYAALHQLVRPLSNEIESLPATLRSALLAAFGLAPRQRSGEAAFHVAMAVLQLLLAAGQTRPVAVIADDAQWFDRDSLEVLGFVARRIQDDPVLLIVATRPLVELPFTDAAEIELEPLAPTEAAELLDRCFPGLPGALRSRVLQTAAGNPLALVELPSIMTAAGEDRAADQDFTSAIPLTRRLERAFTWHRAGLPVSTTTVLLAAACNTSTSASEALQATTLVLGRDVDLDDLDPALALGVVELTSGDLRFRHPLIRSGLVHEATEPTRRAVHRALAELLVEDPDRRAWHRSQVVITDESAAVDLEAAADRADARGAPATALLLLERAAAISTDARARQARWAKAAEIAIQVGNQESARRLLEQLDDDVVPWAGALRALHEQWNWYSGTAEDHDGQRLMTPVWKAAENGRPDLALRVLQPLTHSSSAEVRDAAGAAARRVFEASPAPIGLEVLGQFPQLSKKVLEQVHRGLGHDDLDPETRRVYATAATVALDFDTAVAVLPDAASALLEQGRRASAAQALVSLAVSYLVQGRLAAARPVAREADQLCRETHQRFWGPGAALVLAYLDGLTPGTADPEPGIAAARHATPDEDFVSVHQVLTLMARAACALADSRYAEAADHGRAVFAIPLWARWWGIADYVEAAVRARRLDEVRGLVVELRELVELTSAPYLADQLVFCEALTAAEDDVDRLFERAIDLRPLDNPFLRARLAFAHGVWLRRHRRIREARGRLRQAQSLFAQVGVTPWDATVTRELAASGPSENPGAELLTPQERHVARLVARGLSNREVGQQLLISPRTVSTHLHRVFGKLGITERGQLDPTVLGD